MQRKPINYLSVARQRRLLALAALRRRQRVRLAGSNILPFRPRIVHHFSQG